MASQTLQSQLILTANDQMSSKLNRIAKNSDVATKKVSRGWKQASGVIDSSFKKIGASIAGFVSIGAVVGVLKKGTENFMEFEQGMSEVATLTDQSASQIINNFGKIVESTQLTFGKNQQDVIKALYDGFSAGVPATKEAAKAFLETTGKIAVGGVTDMKSAADILTTVNASFKETGITFDEIGNVIFKTVKMGKTTVPELAANMGKVANTGKNAGLSFQELGAAMAPVVTQLGTAEGLTALNQLLSKMSTPTKEAAKEYEKLNIVMGKTFIKKSGGLLKAIEAVNKAMEKRNIKGDEATKMFRRLIGEDTAFKAALALTSNGGQQYNDTLELMLKKTDLLTEANKKMATESLKTAQAQQKLDIAFKRIGKVTAPIYAEAMTLIAEKMELFANGIPAIIETFKRDFGMGLKIAGAAVVKTATMPFISEVGDQSTKPKNISTESLSEMQKSIISSNKTGTTIINNNVNVNAKNADARQVADIVDKKLKEKEREKKNAPISRRNQ